MLLFSLSANLPYSWTPFESPTVPGFSKLAKSDVPFATLRTLPNGSSLTTIAAACHAEVNCRAFNSDAELKVRADCGWGSTHCVYPQGQPFPAADRVDLYLKQGLAPPTEWLEAVTQGTTLYSSEEPNICEMPEVGNGYVASVVGFASTHVAGLYNGACGNVHKARLPSPIAGISATNSVNGHAAAVQAALDTVGGVYKRRYTLAEATVVEQRIYAHRTRPHVLVTEFELLTGTIAELSLVSLYDFAPRQEERSSRNPLSKTTCPNPGNRTVTRPDGTTYPYFTSCTTHDTDCGKCYLDHACHCNFATHCCDKGAAPSPVPVVGSGCAGTFVTTDVEWTAAITNATLLAHAGVIAKANEDGDHPTVAIVVDNVPSKLTLSAAAGETTLVMFLAVVVASVGMEAGFNATAIALAEHASTRAIGAAQLAKEHTAAWAELTRPHIVVGGVTNTLRAWRLQTHFCSSYYFLLSTIRADWSMGGMSPGGLASQNYEGAVFMDQEMYMAQGLMPWHPSLALSAAQYRIDGSPAAARLAKLFGYKGLMFPWTSATRGNAFGCCSGHGGFEDCIEQHITPDVVWLLRQLYRTTGDKVWLKTKAWPVILGVAQWIVSRVVKTGKNGTSSSSGAAYSLQGVMPIDEWCNQASGCADPGVNDDPQMNGVTIAALEFAIEAASIVGATSDPVWGSIARGLPLLYDANLGNGGVHTMPRGGKDNVSTVIPNSRSTSCPEDINYLSYPLGPQLNISAELTRRDMIYWSDGSRTCLENAGMTAPIHAIAWLKTVPPNITGAEFALNRSMLSVAYGPFNMRNEVDVHTTTIGGHFNNTHFLTGDGGYLQILFNGFGGLMLAAQDGMQLNRPVLPRGTTSLAFKSWSYLKYTLNYTVLNYTMEWSASGEGLCLYRPPFGRGAATALRSVTTTLDIDAFFAGVADPNAAHGRLGSC